MKTNLETIDIKLTDYSVKTTTIDAARIQEGGGILVGHIMCEIIENKLFNDEYKWID